MEYYIPVMRKKGSKVAKAVKAVAAPQAAQKEKKAAVPPVVQKEGKKRKKVEKTKAKSLAVATTKTPVDPFRATVVEALRLLKLYQEKKAEASLDLFDRTQKVGVFLRLTFSRSVNTADLAPTKIRLPHILYGPEASFCLIVRDPQRLWKEKCIAEEKDLPELHRIIDLSHLRKRYVTEEAKRELLNSHDQFYVDQTIVSLMPGLLGRAFRRAKKMPIPYQLNPEETLAPVIKEAQHNAIFLLRPGLYHALRIGNLDWSTEDLVDNIVAGLKGVLQNLSERNTALKSNPEEPTKNLPWELHGVSLYASQSIAIPIYQAHQTEEEPAPKEGQAGDDEEE